jgi:hypothetical protein
MPETTTERRKSTSPQAKGKEGLKCAVEGCKRAYQAKGYCFFHYDKWKRGELPKARYKTCSKEGCHKKVLAHGLCAEHQKKKASEAAAPAAAPAAPAAPASSA